MDNNRARLKSYTIAISAVNDNIIKSLFDLFLIYYEKVNFIDFKNDLLDKDYLLLLKDSKQAQIVGFSSIKIYNFTGPENYHWHGIYSGDTVVDKRYWGQNKLQQRFTFFCLKYRLSNPGVDVYWLLLSKGYKTYLLLSNNFVNYYPQLNNKNSSYRILVNSYCQHLFRQYYDVRLGIVDFGENSQRLKQKVADISSELYQKNKYIAFFENKNPRWKEGKELACIAKLEYRLALKFFLKKIINSLSLRW